MKSQETIRKLAERIEFKLRPAIAPGKNVLQIRVIEVELAPFGALLEAAENLHVIKTTHDRDGSWEAIRIDTLDTLEALRAALSDIQKG